MDYWYRSAAIVLWAREDHERILCQYNFSRACAALAGLAAGENTGPGSPFHRLGEAVVACYPSGQPAPDLVRVRERLAAIAGFKRKGMKKKMHDYHMHMQAGHDVPARQFFPKDMGELQTWGYVDKVREIFAIDFKNALGGTA